MIQAFHHIGIAGAGAWGTALALTAARAGAKVALWGRDAAQMAAMTESGENTRYLPGFSLSNAVTPTNTLSELAGLPLILLAAPAQTLPSLARDLSAIIVPGTVLMVCAKGIDRVSGRLLSHVIHEAAPTARLAVLSGPSFATDVACGLPTAVTLATGDEALGEMLAGALGSPSFRPYWTADVTGVELGGALKNVFAIAAGAVAGRGLGESARAAMIARGFAEMTRFGRAAGADPATFAGLSGLGDLVLTATSTQSRNLRFGVALGQGQNLDAARAAIGTVEGIATASAAARLAADLNVDMPITTALARVLEGSDTLDSVIERLMRRPLKAEL